MQVESYGEQKFAPMTDHLPPEVRRQLMGRIGPRDSSPETAVRRLLFSQGYRYRLHVKALPGTPDIVFSGRKKVIFVHGCFWHGHDCRKGGRLPKTNTAYWAAKISRNRERDRECLRKLKDLGWDALVVWECHIKGDILGEIVRFLGPPRDNPTNASSQVSIGS